MKLALAAAGAVLCGFAAAQVPFDVGYRAWDVVNDIARHNGDKALGGECTRQFRPFVIPGLKPQNAAEQAASAQACRDVARSLCRDARARRTADIDAKCAEFR